MNMIFFGTLNVCLMLSLITPCWSTCWPNSSPTVIPQIQISFTDKFQFSLYPASGQIITKQNRQQGKQKVFYGDFGILRMYQKNIIMIYEGVYLRVTKLKHFIEPIFTKKYKGYEGFEIQIVYEWKFGNKDKKKYENIGVSYFVVADPNADQIKQNQNVTNIENTFASQLIRLQKGSKFQHLKYFQSNPENNANTVYLYQTHKSNLLPFLKENQQQCSTILWILNRQILQIESKNFIELKKYYNIESDTALGDKIVSEQSDAKQNKIYSAILRQENKSHQQKAKTSEGEKSIEKNREKQNESNSCQENQQL